MGQIEMLLLSHAHDRSAIIDADVVDDDGGAVGFPARALVRVQGISVVKQASVAVAVDVAAAVGAAAVLALAVVVVVVAVVDDTRKRAALV